MFPDFRGLTTVFVTLGAFAMVGVLTILAAVGYVIYYLFQHLSWN